MSHVYAEPAAAAQAGDADTARPQVKVGAAHDPLEHEAERVAARILAAVPPPPVSPDDDPALRRSCDCGGTCGGCGDEDETVRRLATGPPSAAPVGAVRAVLTRPGTPLPPGEQAFFERRLGADLGGVTLRTGPDADVAARSVGAKAFTLGSDVVVAAPYGGDRAVLAHELVHVLQARAGRTRGTVRRQPSPATAPATTDEAGDFVRAAADFIEAVRDLLASDIARAERDVGAAAAADRRVAAERAQASVGQAALRTKLDQVQRTYDRQRAIVAADHPAQGRLREAYASFLHTLRDALDRSRTISRELGAAAAQASEQQYQDNLVVWLNANPFLDPRIAGRTAFTAGEATASATMETDVASVALAAAYAVNLTDVARTAAVQGALAAARTSVTAGTPPTSAAATPTAGVATASTELSRWAPARDNAIAVIGRANAAMQAWLAAPASAPGTQATVQRFFGTTDVGYGRLLADRIALIGTQLGGTGSLVMTLAAPTDTECGPLTGGHAATYRVWLCPNAGRMDPTMVVLHETAHAVIPARGAVPRAAGVTTVDRAYAGERLLGRLPTEEALSNAESYAEVIRALGDPTYALRNITTDRVTRACATQSDTDKILDAMARAQSLARRAKDWIEGWRAEYAASGAYSAFTRRVVSPLGAADDVAIDAAFVDMIDIPAEASIWYSAHDVACAAAATGRCAGSVLAWSTKADVTATTVTMRAGGAYPTVVTFCPAFLTAAEDVRNRVAFALVPASWGWAIRQPANLLKYAATAQALWNIDLGAPPASNLGEHQAADTAAAAPARP
ncbi:MAG: hypothetical protein QOE45_2585 [Frankiaceae bacterium]|jgi:hypothetical protein|nr:hypothetical protein [Frankiaceae bacterium]